MAQLREDGQPAALPGCVVQGRDDGLDVEVHVSHAQLWRDDGHTHEAERRGGKER